MSADIAAVAHGEYAGQTGCAVAGRFGCKIADVAVHQSMGAAERARDLSRWDEAVAETQGIGADLDDGGEVWSTISIEGRIADMLESLAPAGRYDAVIP